MKLLYSGLPVLLCISLIASTVAADFDPHYWAKYTEIILPAERPLPPFGVINPSQERLNEANPAHNPDEMRIITGNKREVPYQMVTRRPETRSTEVEVKMVNFSLTGSKDTSFEGIISAKEATYNSIEILTEEQKFFRQMQISGSRDGVSWNRIRGDAVIFDYSDDKRLRHTRITIPDTRYKYIKVIILNRNEKPLKINGFRVFRENRDRGLNENVVSTIRKQETDSKSRTTVAEIELKYPSILHGIEIQMTDRNFYRAVDIFVKKKEDEWTAWGTDFIFNFEGDGFLEMKNIVSFPEVSAREIRVVIRNLDSPPLNINLITAQAYKKMIVFKIEGREKHYLFWGNRLAKAPAYDIAGHVSRQNLNALEIFNLGPIEDNPDYIGSDKALPLTEQYKYLLYILLAIVVAGLAFYQYRVIKKTKAD